MPINVQIYSNANATSKTVVFDFVGEILAASRPDFTPSPANVASTEYYFKVTTAATQDNGTSYPLKIVRSFSELVLNGNNQGDLNTGSTSPYTDIRSMVFDYVYDYINGHSSNAYGSGCSLQRPMKFK